MDGISGGKFICRCVTFVYHQFTGLTGERAFVKNQPVDLCANLKESQDTAVFHHPTRKCGMDQNAASNTFFSVFADA